MSILPAFPVWLALLGFAFGGCGKAPAGAPAVQDASGAIRTFEHFWSHMLLPGLEEPKKGFALTLSHKVPAKLGASPSTFEDVRREIDGSLNPVERRTLVLYGTPEALPREGACWSVSSFGGRGSELRGCLDPQTGDVVVIWIAPEG